MQILAPVFDTSANICNTSHIIYNHIHANINANIKISNNNAHQELLLRLGLTPLLIWLNMNMHTSAYEC